MAVTFKFYHDSALTQEITSGAPLTATQDTSGVTGAIDKIIYLGSTATGNQAQVASNPGVTAIQAAIVDAAGGSGSPSTEFKLALTSGGLASAVAGDPLTLSTTITSGVVNVVAIHTRRDSALTVAGSYTDLTIETQVLIETPV